MQNCMFSKTPSVPEGDVTKRGPLQLKTLKKTCFRCSTLCSRIFFNPLAFASKRVEVLTVTGPPKRASGRVTSHLRLISRFACFSGARAARDSRPSPSSSASSDGGIPRRPFQFCSLDSRRGANPNFEFRRNGWRPRPRAAVAFASSPRNHEEGGTLSFRRAVRRRSSPRLCFAPACFCFRKRGRRG